MAITLHPFLWSVCVVQFGLLSIWATKLLGEKSSSSSKKSTTTTTRPRGKSIMATPPTTGRITRITMFKIPSEENQKKFVDAYGVLAKNQQKGGEPYILSAQASVVNDPRSKGYTVVAQTAFANLDDMKYYDNECPAHLQLKKASKALGMAEPPLVVYYEA